ncbi:hypothetical protein HPB50_003900 [Hyalomma asiaticum]|uniref:Uncharacterized protein n=1 Tax=Hyalomma asiaticum TaxID=266040 RepID=A0ACB7T6X1_HYAAI|nr:hypothetical protein HPB50_003900 [Hyalomma asiaticum]
MRSAVAQGPSQDEIKSLPGLPVKPTFKQYSGFLNAGPNRRLHYWFAASQTSKASLDPVVVWVNAGAGTCSSMLTLMMEHGPFRPTDNGERLVPNEFSWNKESGQNAFDVANVLFLDAPAGSGYSYDATGSYATDDEQAADDTYLAILDFHHKFPLYGTNDLYIFGQGHAAAHVTLVVERLLDEPTVKLTVKEAQSILGTPGLNAYNIYAKCEPSKNDSLFSYDSGESSPMYHRSRKSFVRQLNMAYETLVTYEQWLFQQQIGGYVEYYAGKIVYLTIKVSVAVVG